MGKEFEKTMSRENKTIRMQHKTRQAKAVSSCLASACLLAAEKPLFQD